jgi:hypothetical protein
LEKSSAAVLTDALSPSRPAILPARSGEALILADAVSADFLNASPAFLASFL